MPVSSLEKFDDLDIDGVAEQLNDAVASLQKELRMGNLAAAELWLDSAVDLSHELRGDLTTLFRTIKAEQRERA